MIEEVDKNHFTECFNDVEPFYDALYTLTGIHVAVLSKYSK